MATHDHTGVSDALKAEGSPPRLRFPRSDPFIAPPAVFPADSARAADDGTMSPGLADLFREVDDLDAEWARLPPPPDCPESPDIDATIAYTKAVAAGLALAKPLSERGHQLELRIAEFPDASQADVQAKLEYL